MPATLIGVGPGEPALLTARAIEALGASDEVVVDAGVPEESWRSVVRPDAQISLVPEGRQAQQAARDAMIQAARSERAVARVRTGDGWTSAEALRDVRRLTEARVGFDVLPGLDSKASQWRAWIEAHPLYGRRVVITRMIEQAEESAELLRSRGAEPWICPTIEIAPPPEPGMLDKAAANVGSYQVVAFTSANGVAKFFEALGRQDKDARALSQSRVAAIGPATGRALLERGIRADIVAKDFRGEALAEAILKACQVMGGTRVLIPRALEAREVLPETLRGSGMQVDVVAAYETRPVSRERVQPLKEALGRGEVDAILITSSSTVTSLCEALGPDRALVGRTLLASIGPITTSKAVELGLEVGVTATEYTVPALIGAIEAHWGN
ncbi:MAG: uroporphyrinogen-III synthase [Deltaproteobacteria bacterium]|nr:uroporphyrinogen-III synthase [Deltaproteobacteria bacterium]